MVTVLHNEGNRQHRDVGLSKCIEVAPWSSNQHPSVSMFVASPWNRVQEVRGGSTMLD